MKDTPTIAALRAALEVYHGGPASAHMGHVLIAETEDWPQFDINLKIGRDKSVAVALSRHIAAAVNSAPELLAELDRLRAELAAQTTRADIASECAAQYGAERDRLRAGLETASRQLGEWAEAMRETVAERDRLAAEVAAVRYDFAALQQAIVGDTGASAILAVERMRESLRQIIDQHGQWNNGIWAANIARSAIDAARTATNTSEAKP